MFVRKMIVPAILACILGGSVLAQSPEVKLVVNDAKAMQAFGLDIDVEVLGEGFTWSEGPVWSAVNKTLYLSDVPRSKIYSWSKAEGLKTFLNPSGKPDPSNGYREPGTNGLIMAPDGRIMAANHGSRSIELINLTTKDRETVVSSYEGLKFNSPNDLVLDSDGDLYFTDPPYGLKGLNNSPMKEQAHNGVYRRDTKGNVTLVDNSLSFPNGIELSPDKASLYVAISDPKNPVIMRYQREESGEFGKGHVWFDAGEYVKAGFAGNLDGMVVADNGTVFATGPGGVFILSPEGKEIGRISMDRKTANCTFGEDGKSLFVTASDLLLKVRFKSE